MSKSGQCPHRRTICRLQRGSKRHLRIIHYIFAFGRCSGFVQSALISSSSTTMRRGIYCRFSPKHFSILRPRLEERWFSTIGNEAVNASYRYFVHDFLHLHVLQHKIYNFFGFYVRQLIWNVFRINISITRYYTYSQITYPYKSWNMDC